MPGVPAKCPVRAALKAGSYTGRVELEPGPPLERETRAFDAARAQGIAILEALKKRSTGSKPVPPRAKTKTQEARDVA